MSDRKISPCLFLEVKAVCSGVLFSRFIFAALITRTAVKRDKNLSLIHTVWSQLGGWSWFLSPSDAAGPQAWLCLWILAYANNQKCCLPLSPSLPRPTLTSTGLFSVADSLSDTKLTSRRPHLFATHGQHGCAASAAALPYSGCDTRGCPAHSDWPVAAQFDLHMLTSHLTLVKWSSRSW